MKKLICGISISAVATLLAGCATPPAAPPAPPVAAKAAAAPIRPATVAAAPAGKSVPAHLDPTSRIAKEHSVYFDFDQQAIKSDYTAMLAMHAHYLSANPALAIKLTGYADERGGTEYNLALGQQRAEAVARALRAMGAKDGQLEAVSMGEARPKASGHNEAAWAENRRADLDYPAR